MDLLDAGYWVFDVRYLNFELSGKSYTIKTFFRSLITA